MVILSTQELGHAFGAEDLFEKLNLRLTAKQRVGLVGPNGVGKTTLLLILAGLLEPSEGTVALQNDLSVGYLRQEAVLTFAGKDNTVFEEMLSVFTTLRAQETELQALEKRMATGNVTADVLERYGELQQAFEAAGGYDYQVEIKRILQGLGFPAEEWEMPLDHLSGGQKTRLLLGRLLLEKPDLLILDEPTNHLDAAAVSWLENHLRRYVGTLLIVSHDRYFLDRAVNFIWEMTAEGIAVYKGDYSTYVQQRQLNFMRELTLFNDKKAELEKELDFARRHIAGSKSDLAKGKLRRLTREIVLLEEVGILEMQGKSWSEIGGRQRPFSVNEAAARLKALKPPAGQRAQLSIRLESATTSGEVVMRTRNLQIGYPATPLFSMPNLLVERGARIALIGSNGSGKSTLLKTILGNVDPLSGKIILGDEVVLGYFAQAHDAFDPRRQILTHVRQAAALSEGDARNFLARFHFRGDDVYKEIGALSGGERGRLALALLALQGANFLLLDEPTNHLDIPSQEALQAVLEQFDGTLVLVSHDRYLVNKLATSIWELQEDQLHPFDGSYAAYLGREQLDEDDADRGAKLEAQKAAPTPAPELDWVEQLATPTASTTVTKPKKKSQRPSVKDAALALEIEDAEIWIARIEKELEQARAAGDDAQIEWLEDEYEAALTELERLHELWEA